MFGFFCLVFFGFVMLFWCFVCLLCVVVFCFFFLLAPLLKMLEPQSKI